ncbi:hypothetical protein [Thermotoga profunda]|uniref:hypothetical protein n=1 Tax=Thermotoga profunda TaxID=1508420 RepID=UPI001493F5B2|nr:hypothetical protein [Thermotoga profunda]
MEKRGGMKRRRGQPSSFEEYFEKFQPFLKKICTEYWNKYCYRIDSWNDLYQTIQYLFIYVYNTWQPEKGSFELYLETVMRYKLKSMLNGEYAPWSSESPFTFLKDRKIQLYLVEDEILDQYSYE